MELWFASTVSVQLKTEDLTKVENFKKTPETLGSDGEYPADHWKGQFWYLC